MNKYYLILIKPSPLECYMTYRNRIYSDFELDDLKKDIVEILSSGAGISDIKVIKGTFFPVKSLFDKKENRDG